MVLSLTVPLKGKALFHRGKFFQNILKILGQFRVDHHGMSVPGVGKAQNPCVKALGFLTQLRLFPSVDHIPQNGMTHVGHVDTNLVGTPGLQPTPHVGLATVASHHLPMGDGRLAVMLGDTHFFAVCAVAADGGIHRAGILLQIAADDGLIGARHRMVF